MRIERPEEPESAAAADRIHQAKAVTLDATLNGFRRYFESAEDEWSVGEALVELDLFVKRVDDFRNSKASGQNVLNRMQWFKRVVDASWERSGLDDLAPATLNGLNAAIADHDAALATTLDVLSETVVASRRILQLELGLLLQP